MKAICLWQPWASAMAFGLKKNETRSWPTHYRGDLVICAAKRKMTAQEQEIYDQIVCKPGYELPYGCAVCIVEVYDCVPTKGLQVTLLENALGNYEPGRFAWLTRNLRVLPKPVPVTGRQGLFEVTL